LHSDRSGSRKGKIGARAPGLLALHQWPPGTRQTPSARHRRCNSIASVSQRMRPAAICGLISVRPDSATEAQCKTVAPAHAALSPSWLSQRREVRPDPRRWDDCAIPRFRSLRASLWPALRLYNCGVCRPAAYRVRGNRRLGDTCMAPRFTGS
jgi:hypothetical protein